VKGRGEGGGERKRYKEYQKGKNIRKKWTVRAACVDDL
jgi:hypothetical protein